MSAELLHSNAVEALNKAINECSQPYLGKVLPWSVQAEFQKALDSVVKQWADANSQHYPHLRLNEFSIVAIFDRGFFQLGKSYPLTRFIEKGC